MTFVSKGVLLIESTKDNPKLSSFDNTRWGDAARSYLESIQGFEAETIKEIMTRAKDQAKVNNRRGGSSVEGSLDAGPKDRRARIVDDRRGHA